MNKNKLWFAQLDSFSLCRGGGNGPDHPSQIYAIVKYVNPADTFLDYGCGSGTTFEAVMRYPLFNELLTYKGVDIIEKNVEWCRKHFGKDIFDVNETVSKIDQPDKSWDVVYSRHVVDHLPSFKAGLLEHCRVAKKLVIIVLWGQLLDGEADQVKHITDQGKFYPDEYSNRYSEQNIKKEIVALPDWELVEFAKEVGSEVRGHDTVIVLRRKHDTNK